MVHRLTRVFRARWPSLIARCIVTTTSAVIVAVVGQVVATTLLTERYPGYERLFSVWDASDDSGRRILSADATASLATSALVETVTSYSSSELQVRLEPDSAERPVASAFVSADFFTTLGTGVIAGRPLKPGDFVSTAQPVAVVSQRLSEVWGKSVEPGAAIVVGSTRYLIVGVVNSAFAFPEPGTVVWLPLVLPSHSGWSGQALVKVRSPSNLPAIRLTLQNALVLNGDDRRLTVASLKDVLTGAVASYLWLLFGLAIALLGVALIAGSWEAASDVWDQRSVLSLKRVLGGSVRALVSEQCLEAVGPLTLCLVLAIPATMAAFSALGGIREYVTIPSGSEATARSLGPCLLLVVTAFVVSQAPATLLAIRILLGKGLHVSSYVGRRSYLSDLALIGQIAAVVGICVAASWTAAAIFAMTNQNAGVGARNLVYFRIDLPQKSTEDTAAFVTRLGELHERLDAAGIQATMSNVLPLSEDDQLSSLKIRTPAGDYQADYEMIRIRVVDGNFFSVVGLPCLAGTCFTSSDHSTFPAVVNESFRRHFIGAGDLMGRTIRAGGRAEWTITGVVGETSHDSIFQQAPPQIYLRFSDAPRMVDIARQVATHRIFVATDDSTHNRAPIEALREIVKGQLPEAALGETRVFKSLVWKSLGYRPTVAACAAVLGTSSFVIFVAAFASFVGRETQRRKRDLMICLALGGSPKRIVISQFGRKLVFIALGGGLGIAVGWWTVRFLKSGTFVSQSATVPSPAIFGIAVLLVGAVLLFAILALAAKNLNRVRLDLTLRA